MKKYSKLLLVAICTFFIAITPSFAREFTLESFEEYLEEENLNADSFYLIGEYAFTNLENKDTEYPGNIKMQDAMLAARSIKVNNVNGKVRKDEIFGEMAIYQFDRERSLVGGKLVPTGVVYTKNLVGTTKPGDTFNIKYVDYVFVPEETKAVISANISPEDLAELKVKFGYDATNSNTDVTVTAENKKIKLTGFIAKGDADGSNWPEAEQTGFYYPINVKIENANEKTTIVYSKGQKKETGVDDLTILYALDPNAENKTFEIVVDLDGDGTEYGPTTYTIDYSELVFEKETKVTTKLFDEKDAAYADAVKDLKDVFNFDKNVGELTLKDGKLEGVVLPLDGVKGFKEDTGYYFAYVISMPEGMTKEDLKDVKLVVPADGGTKVVGIESFDTDNSIVLIMQLNPEADKKEFEVVVDVDGDGKEYTPTTVKVNYETLTFAKKTEATISSNLPAADVTDLGALGFTANDANVKLENGKLTGIISTGVADDEKFSSVEAERTGYYYAFNVEVKDATADTTIKVNGKKVTDYKGAESLTVLFALDPNETNKVITITVDKDGDGKNFTTETYTIDYSELVFADQLFVESVQNIEELESAKSVLTFNAEAKDAADNVALLLELNYDGKNEVSKMVSTSTDSEGTETYYYYSQTKADGEYVYESSDNVNWTYSVTALSQDNSAIGEIVATLLGKPESVKVTNIAADGTITMDVLLVSAGTKFDIADIIEVPSDPDTTILTIENDVRVSVEIKNKLISKMSSDLLEAFGNEAKDVFNSITFDVTVSKLTESVTIPEDVVAKATKKQA